MLSLMMPCVIWQIAPYAILHFSQRRRFSTVATTEPHMRMARAIMPAAGADFGCQEEYPAVVWVFVVLPGSFFGGCPVRHATYTRRAASPPPGARARAAQDRGNTRGVQTPPMPKRGHWAPTPWQLGWRNQGHPPPARCARMSRFHAAPRPRARQTCLRCFGLVLGALFLFIPHLGWAPRFFSSLQLH